MNNNDFYKYATKHLRMNGNALDHYMNVTSKAYGPVDQYINPTIIEERPLNVAQMDVFSRLMMDRIIFLGTEMPTALSYVLAFLCGFATLIIMAYVMRAISGLQSSGNIEIGNAVGKVGQVYIPIKPNCAGKVNITVQGQYSEFTAISTSSETLSTGSYVRVVAVDEAGTLVVEPIAVDGKKSL